MLAWVPLSDPLILRRLGKTQEETCELTEVIATILNTPRQLDAGVCRLELAMSDEIADVYAQLDVTVGTLPGLTKDAARWDEQSSALHNVIKAGAKLGRVIARCVIQGLDGKDPETPDTNLDQLSVAIANMYGALNGLVKRMELDEEAIQRRRVQKCEFMLELEAPLQTLV